MRGFSLTILMLVTGTSFLAFTVIMRVLDGVIYDFLLKVGIIAMSIGVFLYLSKMLLRVWERKNSSGISSDRE